jgi:RimJ/RimL family protein N-acetyltransferase
VRMKVRAMRNPVVVGDRVYLRPVEVTDGAAFAEATAREATAFSKTGRLPLSPLMFEREFGGPVPGGPPRSVGFAVVRTTDDRLLGSVALLDIDWVNRSAETASHLLSEEVRGQGYGTEAKMLLIEYAFDRIHLHVLQSWVRATNTRSAAALVKQGYRPAGRRYWNGMQHGTYVDHLIFDLLREEWIVARDAWRAAQAARSVDVPG